MPSFPTMRFVSPTRLPAVVEAEDQRDLPAWVEQHRAWLDAALLEHGAVLMRGFGVASAAEFERVMAGASSGAWVEYREASTPRSHVSGHVFTATDYPAPFRIYLHNENSHVTSWPGRLYFWCEQPPATGGQTPIADCRRIFSRVDSDVRTRFLELGWQYVRTFGYGLGFTWQKVFGVGSAAELEAYCAANRMRAEWIDDAHVRVRYRRWAALRHPISGADAWFNHGLFYNVWNLRGPEAMVLKDFGPERMPYNTYYGDGAPVPADVLQGLHEAYEAERTLFDWQAGDVLVIDNMLVAHGRESFTGTRRVLVGMTGLNRCEAFVDDRALALLP